MAFLQALEPSREPLSTESGRTIGMEGKGKRKKKGKWEGRTNF